MTERIEHTEKYYIAIRVLADRCAHLQKLLDESAVSQSAALHEIRAKRDYFKQRLHDVEEVLQRLAEGCESADRFVEIMGERE